MSKEITNQIRQYIAHNETQQAIDSLLEVAERPAYAHLRDTITTLSASYINFQTQRNRGLLSADEQARLLARILDGLLQITQEIENPKIAAKEAASQSSLPLNIPKPVWIIGLVLALMLAIWGIAQNYVATKKFTASGPFDIKVLIHGRGGVDDLILRGQGTVYLDIPGDRREAPIDNRGLASFEQIPTEYNGRQVRIMIQHAQPYRLIHADSLFILKADAMYAVEAKLFQTDTIYGRIYDFSSEQSLEGVRVSLHQIEAFTNKYGEFKLGIPETYQTKFQRVTFMREGYKTEILDSIPVHTQQEIVMPMHRRR